MLLKFNKKVSNFSKYRVIVLALSLCIFNHIINTNIAFSSEKTLDISKNNLDAKKIKIAVIPFTNLSGKNENDWIGSGFSETMITSLSKIQKVQITERFLMNQVLKEISFQQSGFIDEKSLVKVGKLTGANIIISGSFQVINNEIVINSRFIDVEKGIVESGSASYIRGEINKIFDLEEKLAKEFSDKFNLKITDQENSNIKSTIYATNSIEANKLYLKAIEKNMNGGFNGKLEAIDLLEKSLKIDPNYPLALSLLGEVQSEYAFSDKIFSQVFRTKSKYDYYHYEGIKNLKKALELAPNSLEVNRSMAKVFLTEGNISDAQKYIDKALAINPNDISSIITKGKLNKETLRSALDKSLEIDKFNYEVYLELGNYYVYKENNQHDGVISLLKAIELNPNSWIANMQIVQAYIRANDIKSAIAWADRMLLLNKDKISYMVASYAYLGANDFSKMKSLYEEMDKIENSPFIKSTLAGIYLRDKEYQKVFNYIKKAIDLYPEDPYLNESLSEVYMEYYNNCRFAIYHHKIYLKNLDKIFIPENIIKIQKSNGEERLKELEKNCNSN